MTKWDRVLVIAIALMAITALPVATALAGGGADRVVITGPHGRTVLPIGVPRRVTVEGALGPVEVVISDGEVRVTESSCPDKLCVRSGPVAAAGHAVVCAPNGVTVVVGGDDRGVFDAVVR